MVINVGIFVELIEGVNEVGFGDGIFDGNNFDGFILGVVALVG